MVKISTKKLKEYIAEEKESAKSYRKYGYPGIARDELRHRSILQKELNRRMKTKKGSKGR